MENSHPRGIYAVPLLAILPAGYHSLRVDGSLRASSCIRLTLHTTVRQVVPTISTNSRQAASSTIDARVSIAGWLYMDGRHQVAMVATAYKYNSIQKWRKAQEYDGVIIW